MYEFCVCQFLQPVTVTLKRSSPASQPLLHGLVSSTNLLSVLCSIIQVVIKGIKHYQPSIIASGTPTVTNNQLDFVLLSTTVTPVVQTFVSPLVIHVIHHSLTPFLAIRMQGDQGKDKPPCSVSFPM